MATSTDAKYQKVFGDPPVRLAPERGLNLPDVPNVDVGGPVTGSLSPLAEFQYALTTLLVRDMREAVGMDGWSSEMTDALLKAVQSATGRYWRVKRMRTLIQDANGAVHDDRGWASVLEPTTDLYGLKVTARYARPFTEDEQHARDERKAALIWSVGDGSTPPPARVSTLTLLGQDEWWKPQKADAIRLVDMAVTHRANLLDWLYRRAHGFHEREISQFAGLLSGPMGPSGDMATDAADREFDRLSDQDAIAWMDGQPLVRRLVKLIRECEIRPVCRSCHRPWKRKLRGTANCTSPTNRHGPWVLAAALTLGNIGGSTENTVDGAQSSGHAPVSDDGYSDDPQELR